MFGSVEFKVIMRKIKDHIIIVAFFLAGTAIFVGCFPLNDMRLIVQKPPSQWNDDDCRTVIAVATAHNLRKEPRVEVFVTPFSPQVIFALCRRDQQRLKWSDEVFKIKLEERFMEDLGVYIDARNNSIFDKRGNFYREISQVDSIMLLVTLKNKTWPCVSPIVSTTIRVDEKDVPVYYPLFGNNLSNVPCHMPDISDLEESIFLMNDRQELLKPRIVWGRRNNVLSREEKLLVVFSMTSNGENFLAGTEKTWLLINKIDGDVKLELPLETFRLGASF